MDDPYAVIPTQSAPVATKPAAFSDPYGTDVTKQPMQPKQKVQHDPGWLGRIGAAAKWAADSPVAQGANAVLGAPDNAIVGGELAASNHGNLGDILRGAWTGLTNPGQATENVHQLEQHWHLPQPGVGKNANIAQRAAQVAEDTAIQSQSAIIPGLDIATGAKWLGKIVKAIPGVEGAAKAVGNSTVADTVRGTFDADHYLNKLVTPMGRAYVKAGMATKPIVNGVAQHFDPKALTGVVQTVNGLKPGVTPTALQAYLEVGKGRAILESQLKSVKDDTILKALSSYQRDALFVLPFAHMKNLTVLAGLGPGGLGTIKRGIEYAGLLAKKDAATEARLQTFKDIGAAAEYRGTGAAQANKFAKIPGVGKLTDWSNDALATYDNGLRLAVAEKLAKRGMGDVEIGAQIRDIMGDYLHPSDFTAAMRGVGANFPAWRMQIVPKAMFKAVKEQPRAAKLYARTASNISNDITEPMFGTSLDVGGPAEDASKLAEAPTGTVNYLTSPSTMGPMAGLFSLKQDIAEGKQAQWAKQEAESFVPFGSVLSKIPGLDPYQDKGPLPLNMALGTVGSYMQDTPTTKQRISSLKRQGIKGKDLKNELRMEGRIHDPYGVIQ